MLSSWRSNVRIWCTQNPFSAKFLRVFFASGCGPAGGWLEAGCQANLHVIHCWLWTGCRLGASLHYWKLDDFNAFYVHFCFWPWASCQYQLRFGQFHWICPGNEVVGVRKMVCNCFPTATRLVWDKLLMFADHSSSSQQLKAHSITTSRGAIDD